MSGVSDSLGFWPWLAIAGLGAFHGLNPGMGWLFIVALGLHRQNRRIIWLALVPIALGHAVSVAAIALAFLWVDWFVDGRAFRVSATLILIGWAFYHWRFRHRHRVRFGMQVGLAGLFVWSFLMAAAHGAGLMLWPALMPLCPPSSASASSVSGPLAAGLAGVGVHTLAMLSATAAIAATIYEWVGLEVLRRAWLNIDVLWVAALVATGMLMLSNTF
ncbi:MAG TPA: hypothetical protein VKC66_22615 [Xanthobacteraceae bacterium]|nr:hypothetical protein [Xanthobacteraceae bacterium]